MKCQHCGLQLVATMRKRDQRFSILRVVPVVQALCNRVQNTAADAWNERLCDRAANLENVAELAHLTAMAEVPSPVEITSFSVVLSVPFGRSRAVFIFVS